MENKEQEDWAKWEHEQIVFKDLVDCYGYDYDKVTKHIYYLTIDDEDELDYLFSGDNGQNGSFHKIFTKL